LVTALHFLLAFFTGQRDEWTAATRRIRRTHMIVSIAEPAKLPAKDSATPPDLAKPRVRVSQKRGKLALTVTTARKGLDAPVVRPGTKKAKILQLLQRPQGASLTELAKATKWQAHSVRGFLSGAVKGKMHLKITSTKRDDGQRAYRVPSK
jgi:uncharacterized protein DUF3489